MRLIIAGGRDYHLSDEELIVLDLIHKIHGVTEVITGGATGVDTDAFGWAREQKIDYRAVLPDWGTYGKAAGPIRNAEMAKMADACICFKGGNGTIDMLMKAKAQKLLVWDYTGILCNLTR